jgi:TDG/mug DNA glycosylase family protein
MGSRASREVPWRPTRAELERAVSRRVADVIAPDLEILYCGINPGLYSAAVGHHFARPGNRFWPVLHLAGLTPERLGPFEEARLLEHGQGITNLVARATARAEEISALELARGAIRLRRKVERYRPAKVAVLGLGAYRRAFVVPSAQVGLQPDPFGGARLWVLPNPSGLNAHYQLAELARLFARLR